MEEVILTEEQLQEKLIEWQKRLRLQDWIIKARICRIHNIPNEAMACVIPTLSKKMALIKILDPNDYDPDLVFPQDMENSLVHELLHLHFEPLGLDDDKHTELEQAIECIASGLLSAIRS
ncbi:hypothetical protein J1P26_20080 [Neobacillus sp. MM2021_6]|uniref:hypothetical protein n=1 Tax=Bacillaceae TaxID=186817 RepID=UPI0014082657|nr:MULTISPECIES: hypothetical protein [Bacillaceae]MBO0962008.1 hypothetical protein [Neobacillus sp. MM2021_6]NHC20297.1 hypothetical protein [Bacillus sp. MM2020_4]